ncbi:pyridoxal kinase [Cardinium endosymbiont of Oedothorax gibbosus]|uniref:pyridoxal kinase n=1 Tax=Cardinium endosymbiont of Oedothorax gibbosus TaxID=931101 RepID=UPI00211320ED|nr:pyridoxal kinase [Cardinium endosymbiont of Oedothorax gibbosus]
MNPELTLLQSLGLEVWTVHTVQFSNHRGYGDWKGQVFSAQHITDLIQGLEAQGLAEKCDGILSGYIGDRSIGKVIINTVERFKKINPNLFYLCDPVMGSNDHKRCFVQEDIPPFFKEYLSVADIITPNHFEAEMLYGAKINNTQQLKQAAYFFHQQGIKTVMVTDLQ